MICYATNQKALCFTESYNFNKSNNKNMNETMENIPENDKKVEKVIKNPERFAEDMKEVRTIMVEIRKAYEENPENRIVTKEYLEKLEKAINGMEECL